MKDEPLRLAEEVVAHAIAALKLAQVHKISSETGLSYMTYASHAFTSAAALRALARESDNG